MLADYARHLVNIKNNLIRCGVSLEVRNSYSYEELFCLGERLTSILYFYSIMAISGSSNSLKDFMLPLDSYYYSKLKDKYFEEYLLERENYLKVSASALIKRECLNKVQEQTNIEMKPVASSIDSCYNKIESSNSFLSAVSRATEEVEDETEFVEQSSLNEQDTDEDDDFAQQSYKEVTSEEVDIVEDEDDDFVTQEYVSSGNESKDEIIEESSYGNWGNDDDFVDYNKESDEVKEENNTDDVFGNWGTTEEDELDEVIESGEENNESENWDGDNEGGDTEVSDESESEDIFGSWANDEEEDAQSESYAEIESEDVFDNWNTDDEDDTLEQTQEPVEEEFNFSSWGSDDDDQIESDEEPIRLDKEYSFSSWGSDDDEEDVTSSSKNIIATDTVSRKTYEESHISKDFVSIDKTANMMEKIAGSLISKSKILKSKAINSLLSGSENKE